MLDKNKVFQLSEDFSQASQCLRYQVGCIIVDEDFENWLSWGYNKLIPSESKCIDKCEKVENCIKMFHAEEVAITNALNTGLNLKNAIMIITYSPCFYCAKLIILTGISKIIYKNVYNDKRCDVLDLLKRNNIKVERISNEDSMEVSTAKCGI